MRWFILSFLLISAVPAGPMIAATDPATCERAARFVSDESGVPYEALTGLVSTPAMESNPAPTWPWTVSRDNTGAWFETRDEALAFAYRTFKRDGLDFELGCFQINFAIHGSQFASIDEMFDPLTNARYAARYLGLLHEEFGDWPAAIEAFRLRDRSAVIKHLPRLAGYREGTPASVPPPRGIGSLVRTGGSTDPLVTFESR